MAYINAFNKLKSSKPILQRSLDSQEFGFASHLLVDLSEVAPADELFFKGQLLPLQSNQRLHLVQPLSSSPCLEQVLSHTIATGTSAVGKDKLVTKDVCQDDDVIEFNSCRLEREFSLKYLENTSQEEEHMLLNHMQCLHSFNESSSCIAKDDKVNHFSSKNKGFLELHCSECAGSQTEDRIEEHGFLSWCEDDELHTCIHDVCYSSCKFMSTNDATIDPGSSSFRSQHSGFWDSATDKDMMDSSSSRDSNGSSQDSYFDPKSIQIKASTFMNASCHPHQPESIKPMSFSIPWKSALFRQGSCRKQAPHQDSSVIFSKMRFAEDLGKLQASGTAPSNAVKKAPLPLKLNMETNGHKQEKQGQNQRSLHPSSATIDGCYSANVMALPKNSTQDGDAGSAKSLVQGESKSFRMSMAKGIDVGTSISDEEARKHRSAAVKERWQMCARRLKPFYEMKRGWMGMDECIKRAYLEVDHGSVCSSRPANASMQRRLYHQPSSSNALKSQKLPSPQQKQANGYHNRVIAMASCPPSSAISSHNHSGILAVLDPNQRISIPNKPPHSTKPSSKLLNLPLKSSTPSTIDAGACTINNSIKSSGNTNNNYRSISTMQELHSALQSAIAHCKESNKKLDSAVKI